MAPRFLTQDWCDEVTARLNDDDVARGLAGWANMALNYRVTDVPDQGEVRYFRRFADDEVTFALGEAPEAELQLMFPYDVAVEINKGGLDVPTAFSQKRLEVEGELAPLMLYQSELVSITKTLADIPTEY